MTYVDGFLLPLPEKNVEAYRRMAEEAGRIWLEHGALQYVECIADDVPEGKHTDFFRSVQRKEGETVVFAWVLYRSREERDTIMKKVMTDPRLSHWAENMPFDGKRIVSGGFKTLVEM